MRKVPRQSRAVRRADADVGALAADDGRERVDDGDARDHERDDDGGEAGDARDGEHGDDAERVAEQERSGIPEEYACRVEVVAQEAERGSGERDGEGRGVRPAGHDGEYEHREACDAGET